METLCAPFYDTHRAKHRVSIPPGVYFGILFFGHFDGIESEGSGCWSCEDSLSLREFLSLNLDEPVPDHSTLTRARLSREHY